LRYFPGWKEQYTKTDCYRSSKVLKKDLAKGIFYCDKFSIDIIRGNYYNDLDTRPTREDLEIFMVKSELEFTIFGTQKIMARFVQFLAQINNKQIPIPKCFKDCEFDSFHLHKKYSPELYNQWNHELQSLWAFDIDPRYNTSKHHIEEMKRPLKYTIPFKVIYNLDTIDFNFNQSEEQIKNQTRIA